MQNRSLSLSLILVLFLTVVVTAQPASAQDNAVQQHKDIIRSIIDEAYNRGNIAAMNPVFTADYKRIPGDSNLNNVKASILALRAAMPDMKATINLMIAEASWVAVRLKIEGTLKNELVFPNSPPIKPNNQPIKLEANLAFHFNDKGQVFEEWNGFDNLGFLAQIGVVPPPKVAPDALPDKIEVGAAGSEQRNKDTIRAYLDGIAKGDFAIVEQRFKPELNAHNSFGKLDRLAMIADLTSLRRALPDLSVNVTDLVAEGDWVAALYRIKGTFTAPYVGGDGSKLPPTNKPVDLVIITLFRFDQQGMVTESWELYDSWNFLSQLGLTIRPTPTKK